MAMDGTNNLRLNVTKDDVQSSLNEDCIEEDLNDLRGEINEIKSLLKELVNGN